MEYLIENIREKGTYEYDEIDAQNTSFSYEEKIVALSGYFDQYILMDKDEVKEQLKEYGISPSGQVATDIIELILFEEEETIFKILESKNKTDPHILLKVLINFPKFMQDVYISASKYSLRNISLITLQMIDRGLEGPAKTFKQWKELKVKVKKGSKAIKIIVPNRINVRRRGRGDDEEMTYFNFKGVLFAESQTDSKGVKLKSRDEIFDKIAEKNNVDLELSEREILQKTLQSYDRGMRSHLYNFMALLTGLKTKNIYDTIAFVNEAKPIQLKPFIDTINKILKH